MSSQVRALLVGINAYPPGVGALSGCVNDVDHFRDYLVRNFDPSRLGIEVLKDADATRDNLIRAFRQHLGKAGPGDVAVFHYCGHGARWASAAAFHDFYPDGKDEGLVCVDSRRPGGYDLADKELAVLIAEVADRGAHVAVILDCCHSHQLRHAKSWSLSQKFSHRHQKTCSSVLRIRQSHPVCLLQGAQHDRGSLLWLE